MKELITTTLKNSAELKLKVADSLADEIARAAEVLIAALRAGKKILLCGNGGSAADSQHLAAELIGRFKKERKSIPAIALTTDTSILTAIGNDYGFDKIFARQVEGLGNEGDVLIAITTSGKSANLIKAIETARAKKMKVITLLGGNGGSMKSLGDINLLLPSSDTPRVQEVQITIGHILCQLAEDALSPKL